MLLISYWNTYLQRLVQRFCNLSDYLLHITICILHDAWRLLSLKTQITTVTKEEGLLAVDNESLAVVGDLVAINPSVRIRQGPTGVEPTRSLWQRCEGSTCFLGKGVEAKSRCREAPQGLRPESRLEEVQCESWQRWAWITVSCLHCCMMGD